MPKKLKYETFNPYIYAQIPEEARVLDVGCATGSLGEHLRQEKKPRYLAGIEYDKEAAQRASVFYDQTITTDLESVCNLPFEKCFFDVIVLSDVLEHLRNPLSVLRHLVQYLAPRGIVLISVPNVAFVTARLSLLFGKFEYCQGGGVMDENHLRFFTKKSITDLISRAGLKITFVRGYNLVKPRFFFLKILGAIQPELFSIQFLVKATKE